MNLKNFIKKKFAKDNSQYLLYTYDKSGLIEINKVSLTKLTKYLKTNEKQIIKIEIKLISK